MQSYRNDMWIMAFLLFVVADLATTYAGMLEPTIHEANPFAQQWYNSGNIAMLALFKIVLFGMFYLFDIAIYNIEKQINSPIPLMVIPIYLIWLIVPIILNNVALLLESGLWFETILITITLCIASYVVLNRNALNN